MSRLQAVGCFCSWDMHLMKPVSMSTQADIIVCVHRVQRSLSCILVSRERSEGRCWRRLEDRRWWVVGSKRGEGRGGGVWFADLVLAVMEEKQTDLTVTNEPSPLPAPTVSFLVNSFPYLQSRTAFSGTSAHLFASLPPTSHAFPNSLLLNFTLQLLGLLITSLTVSLKQHPSIQ